MMYRFLIIVFTLVCFSCQSEQQKQSSNVADGICKCYESLMKVNDKTKSFLKNGKGKQAEKLIPEMTALNTQAKECILKLTKDSRKDKSLDVLILEEAIEHSSCPQVWPSVKEVLFE